MSASVSVKWWGVTSQVTRAFARLARRTDFRESPAERCATWRRPPEAWASCTSRSTTSASAEADVVDRDVQIAQASGGRLHVAHLSAGDSLKSVRRAKRAKARVTCEVTPHHFTLTDADIRDY